MIYIIIAIVDAANFNVTLENFLLLVAYWRPMGNHFVPGTFCFRQRKYNVEDWNTPSNLPPGCAAFAGDWFGRGYLWATQYIFTGPLSMALGGMDVGFELRIVLAAFAYLVLRRAEVNVSRR